MFDGVEIIDFAGPYEVFGQAGFDVYTVSADGGPVTTAMNLSVNVDHDFASAPEADILLVPGGNVRAASQDPRTIEFVKKYAGTADHVLSVCTGSFVLAATGLLDGKSATTFHRSFDSMARAYPTVEIVRDRRWVDTGKLVTSAGLSSGIDAALHVVAEVHGIDYARTVALTLEYDWQPGDREGFIRGLLADTHLLMPANLDFPDGTHVHPVLSSGDERRWRSEFSVTSALPREAFIERLRTLAAADTSLTVAPGVAGDSVSWQHTDAAGRWTQTLTTGDAAHGGDFTLIAELTALD
jgi:putative intracellular protease/amidase